MGLEIRDGLSRITCTQEAKLRPMTSTGRDVARRNEASSVTGQGEKDEPSENCFHLIISLNRSSSLKKIPMCFSILPLHTMTCYFVSSELTAVTYKPQHPKSLTQWMLIFGSCEVQRGVSDAQGTSKRSFRDPGSFHLGSA